MRASHAGEHTVTTNNIESSPEGRLISECPQGGVLSSLLGNPVVNKLLEEIEGQERRVMGYADILIMMVRRPY